MKKKSDIDLGRLIQIWSWALGQKIVQPKYRGLININASKWPKPKNASKWPKSKNASKWSNPKNVSKWSNPKNIAK